MKLTTKHNKSDENPPSVEPRTLLDHHRRLLEEASGIDPDVIAERGYWTAMAKDELAEIGFSPSQQRVPALVLPKYSTAGVNGLFEIRPDNPRVEQRGGKARPRKYESPTGSRPMIDVHPRSLPVLGDPSVLLLMGEGIRKGDAAVSVGFHQLNLLGVYGWRGTNDQGGKRTLTDFDDIALNDRRLCILYDSDGADDPQVQQGAIRSRDALQRRRAKAFVLFLPPGPNGEKVGEDDFLATGGDLLALILEAEATPTGVFAAKLRRFHLTDYGNAERLVAQHHDDIRYSRPADAWHVWNGSHWTDDGWALIERRAKETVRKIYRDVELAASDDEAKAIVDHARKSEAAPRLNALVTLARSEPGIPIAPTDFDTDPLLLNVRNGTLDLRTGELRPHRRTDLISKIIPFDYDPDASCPRWEQFIAEITSGRPMLGEFLQRAVGYSLTGDTRERSFFVGYGEARAGKTTFYEAIAAMLGPYAAQTAVQTLLTKRDQDRPGNELAVLRGVRFVSASEPAEGARLDVALVKALTGQDPITARFLFHEFFTYLPEFKLWLMTNHKPIIRETHQAIWDRVKLIPFDVRFYAPDEPAPPGTPRQDPTLKETLRSELPGILAWAVEGCLAWQRDGLGTPQEVRAATEAYREEMDILGNFLEDRCVVTEQARVSASALYTAYKTWCEASGEYQKSQTLVGKLLAERGFTSDRVGKPQVRTWFGVGLRDENDAPEDPEPPSKGPESSDQQDDIVDTTPKRAEKRTVDTFDRQTRVDAFSGNSATCSDKEQTFRETRLNLSTPQNVSTAGFESVRIASDDELATILPDLLAADVLGLDVETTGLNPRGDSLRLVQFATRDHVYLIDPNAVDLAALEPILTTATSTIIGHNLGFDLSFLHAAGLPIPAGDRLFDTLVASQLIDGGAHPNGNTIDDPAGTTGRGGKPLKVGYHSLAAVAHRWLGQTLDKSLQTSDWSGSLSDEQLAYAAKDAAILLPLRDALNCALKADGLENVAALEFAALLAIIWMEAAGVPLDVAAWTVLRDGAIATLAAVDAELAVVLPGVNVDSPAQLTAALASLGITVPNVQEATLRAVADQHPAVDLVLRRKDVKKRVSTYGDGYLSHVHPVTGRIHASYRLIGAASGRMSCSKPNLQNIPREIDYRRCVRPSAGRVLIKADYSQIELRIAAQVSGDAAMQEAFRTGDDLHTKTARAVLGREPTKHDRQLAKALNFGLLYGMGATKLRSYAETDYGVTLTSGEATRFREQFFRTYPGIRTWQRSHQSADPITTHTLAGRLRKEVAFYAEQLASPISGTGADVLKRALARLWKYRAAVPSAALILVVHDEIVVEVDADEAEHGVAWVIEHMTAAGAELLTDVPVEVEAHIVADWSGTPVSEGNV